MRTSLQDSAEQQSCDDYRARGSRQGQPHERRDSEHEHEQRGEEMAGFRSAFVLLPFLPRLGASCRHSCCFTSVLTSETDL